MINFFKNLPNKPYHVRLQFFWIFVIISIVLIGWLWLKSLEHSLSLNNIGGFEKKKSGDGSSIFSELKNNLYFAKGEISGFLGKFNQKPEKINGEYYPSYYEKEREVLKLPD